MSKSKSKSKASSLPPFDKYHYYVHSVQSAAHDASLIRKMTKQYCPKITDLVLQEDFCGTAALCYEWTELHPKFRAVGIDLDKKALAWGVKHHTPHHSKQAVARVKTICDNVLKVHPIKPHVICALNFSYFFIRAREEMLRYFKASRAALQNHGLLVLDAFGGPNYQLPNSDKRRNAAEKFSFWWEVETFDALSHEMTCHLHYQRQGERRRERVFSYDWRLWGVPEITEILRDAGFSKVHYWAEGVDKKGHGNGNYRPVRKESDCEAWVCYIVAQK